ncbi:MAG: hypothetical protein OXM02_13940 [Bacteroidota bacterium]|nr:hypothetical protein [Bacteroidota bacterium]
MNKLSRSFVRARKESLHIVTAWLVCGAWTLGYCALFAYSEEPPALIWGLPSWVLFGIVLPWALATVFSIWYALVAIQDDDARPAA